MEKIYSAKLLDDAKEQAYKEFEAEGADRDEIEFTILEQPVKKLFSTKGEFKIKAEWNPVNMDVTNDFSSSVVDTEEKEKVDETDYEPVYQTEAESTDAFEDEKDMSEVPVTGDKIERAIAYLTDVLDKLGIKDFTITPIKHRETVVLDIEGDELGVVIGRRGETLDALQYLTILAGNKGEDDYCRLSIDCCGYRRKRREALETLAIRTAKKVLKAGRRITLEPMNPYERRIIHSKVAEISGVSSRSIGDEPFRKVVISANEPYRGPRRSSRNGNYSTDSYKRSSGFSTSFEREYKRKDAPSEVSEFSEETVELEKSVSLYGKIEL